MLRWTCCNQLDCLLARQTLSHKSYFDIADQTCIPHLGNAQGHAKHEQLQQVTYGCHGVLSKYVLRLYVECSTSMQQKESPCEASAETSKAAGAMLLLEGMLLSVSGAAVYPEASACHVC